MSGSYTSSCISPFGRSSARTIGGAQIAPMRRTRSARNYRPRSSCSEANLEWAPVLGTSGSSTFDASTCIGSGTSSTTAPSTGRRPPSKSLPSGTQAGAEVRRSSWSKGRMKRSPAALAHSTRPIQPPVADTNHPSCDASGAANRSPFTFYYRAIQGGSNTRFALTPLSHGRPAGLGPGTSSEAVWGGAKQPGEACAVGTREYCSRHLPNSPLLPPRPPSGLSPSGTTNADSVRPSVPAYSILRPAGAPTCSKSGRLPEREPPGSPVRGRPRPQAARSAWTNGQPLARGRAALLQSFATPSSRLAGRPQAVHSRPGGPAPRLHQPGLGP